MRKVLLPKDYIRLRLTGEFATEVSDASGTSLFNVKKRDWAYEVMDAIDIPRQWMPKVYESPEVSGRVTAEAAALTGLAPGTPVVGGGGDQAAGAVGNGIVEPGIISSTVGTSGVVFAFADKPVVDPKLRVHTMCHAVPGKWHVMGMHALRRREPEVVSRHVRRSRDLGRRGAGARPLRRDERGGGAGAGGKRGADLSALPHRRTRPIRGSQRARSLLRHYSKDATGRIS